jgi:hypothetical protein
MDIGRAFTYPFEDKDWLKKIAIGGVVTIVPIVNFIAVGYAFRTLRNLLDGQETPLPEWDDWGGDFMLGLIPALAGIVYQIPTWILSMISGIFAGSDSGAAGLLGLVFGCLSAVYGLVLGIIMPAMYLRYARSGEFNTFFQFPEAIAFIRENLSEYIITVLMILVAFIAAGIVGGVACGIGTIFTTFIAGLVSAHLLAQLGGAPLPAKTDSTPSTF